MPWRASLVRPMVQALILVGGIGLFILGRSFLTDGMNNWPATNCGPF
jgi:hypothetical protein